MTIPEINTASKDLITLYTWQNPVWDIIKEKRDLSKAPQAWKEKWLVLKPLYNRLEEKIKTRDFLFCF